MKDIFLTAILTIAAGAVQAHDFTLGEITVARPWAAEMPAVAPTGAGYMVISNAGPTDQLIGVRAANEVAAAVELHRTVHEGHVMKMREQQSVELPAGGDVVFEPGGLHVMFIGVATPFRQGDRFPLVLTFKNAGELTVTMTVEPRDGGAPHHDTNRDANRDAPAHQRKHHGD